jgi:hypothetical protein
MRPDLGACRDTGLPAQDRERVDGRVSLELDLRLDPGRLRIDDRHPGEHVLFVDARA